MQDLNSETFNYQNSLILFYRPLVFRCLSATESFGVFPETCIEDLLPQVSDSGRLGWGQECAFRTSSHMMLLLAKKECFQNHCAVWWCLSDTEGEKEGSLHHYLTGRWLVFKKQSQQSQCLNLGPGSYLQHVCRSFYLNILLCKMEIRTAPIS